MLQNFAHAHFTVSQCTAVERNWRGIAAIRANRNLRASRMSEAIFLCNGVHERTTKRLLLTKEVIRFSGLSENSAKFGLTGYSRTHIAGQLTNAKVAILPSGFFHPRKMEPRASPPSSSGTDRRAQFKYKKDSVAVFVVLAFRNWKF